MQQTDSQQRQQAQELRLIAQGVVFPAEKEIPGILRRDRSAESVVKDLFMEATDDGILAIETVLAACREEVLRKGPRVSAAGEAGAPEPGPDSEEEP